MGSQARRITNIAGQALIGLAAIIVILSIRSSFASASTGAVTDFANYHPALAAGCSGSNTLEGVAFTSPQGTATDLRRLAVNPGDTVTMTWTSFAPKCAGVDVSLTMNESASGQFDMNTNQELLPGYATCGQACVPVDGVYSLSVTTPSASTVCYFQIDALLGQPLALVGPDGSYYSSVLRRDGGADMLVSAKNAGNGCTETAVLSETTEVLLPQAQPLPVPEVVVLNANAETLPFTGSTSLPLTLMAVTLMAIGTGLMVTSRRMQTI